MWEANNTTQPQWSKRTNHQVNLLPEEVGKRPTAFYTLLFSVLACFAQSRSQTGLPFGLGGHHQSQSSPNYKTSAQFFFLFHEYLVDVTLACKGALCTARCYSAVLARMVHNFKVMGNFETILYETGDGG